MLSSRLTAFVIPMSQKMVIAMLTGTDEVHGRVRPPTPTVAAPKKMSRAAPIICPMSF
jgi:hypothetical protein